MSATLYNDWYVSAQWSDVGPSYGSFSEEQKHNVDKIYAIFHALGWTDNAIAGMLGNMQVESGLDPACSYPKIGNTLADIDNTHAQNYPDNAYGLVQWKGRGTVDPDNNQLVGYAIRYGYEWYDGDIQMNRLTWEYQEPAKFHPMTVDGVYYTFASYAASTSSPSVLAKAWMRCYEGTYSVLSNRQSNAEYWYTYIHSEPPTPDDWITGDDFSTLAVAYDPDITGVPISYNTLDCFGFLQKVWRDITAVGSSGRLVKPNSPPLTNGTNSLWRENISPYPSYTFNTESPDFQNPCPVLWYKDTISNCILDYGEIPAGAVLFHQISEAGPPAIPPQYEGDGIGNFAHVGIYIGNNEVMQSGGRDASSNPFWQGGVHRSTYDSSAWNYVAFVVYVDPTGSEPPPPPPPPGPDIDYWMMFVYNINKRKVIKNVKRFV